MSDARLEHGLDGMGTLRQARNPFWQISPKPGVDRNPLKGYWAPNHATPDYCDSYDIRQFLAYGFILCYDNLAPQYFTAWNMVHAEAIQELRAGFLNVVEVAILHFERKRLNVGEEHFDWDSYGEHIHIGNSDEGDAEEFCFTWAPHCVREEAIGIGLYFQVMAGQGGAGDDQVIWLSLEVLKDLKAVRDAIEKAREVNNYALGDTTVWAREEWEDILGEQQ